MIAFRANANPQIGAGHVMRCLSIADAYQNNGHHCLFVMSSNDLSDTVKAHGHEIIILNSDYSNMDAEPVSFLHDYDLSILFVDSYNVTESYMKKLHTQISLRNIPLVYIDDRCDFPYTCDILLNYNIYAEENKYKNLYRHNRPHFLLGTSYTPLRSEFKSSSPKIMPTSGQNILVSTGGSDTEHFTVELIKASLNSKMNFIFVIGAMNPDKDKIHRLAAGHENISLKENVTRMSELMNSSDVAISAAGSTLYELCATQTPTVTYILADNQIPAAERFSEKGIIKNYGDIRGDHKTEHAHKIIKMAEELAENLEERICIAKQMHALIDGNGAQRIITYLASPKSFT